MFEISFKYNLKQKQSELLVKVYHWTLWAFFQMCLFMASLWCTSLTAVSDDKLDMEILHLVIVSRYTPSGQTKTHYLSR